VNIFRPLLSVECAMRAVIHKS